jgi:hypothetical protein
VVETFLMLEDRFILLKKKERKFSPKPEIISNRKAHLSHSRGIAGEKGLLCIM